MSNYHFEHIESVVYDTIVTNRYRVYHKTTGYVCDCETDDDAELLIEYLDSKDNDKAALENALDVCSEKRQELQRNILTAHMAIINANDGIIQANENTTLIKKGIGQIQNEVENLIEENKRLHQQLADALGADETTADSYNSEFRHNPDDDIEVIEANDDKSQCNVCGEYKPNVGVVWADDGGIITACPDCNNGNNPIVQNFDDTESNMPH